MPLGKLTAMGRLEWALLVTLSILWGGSFFFMEVAVVSLPPFTVVILRVGLAAVALNFIVRLFGTSMPTQPSVWKTFLIMGVLNNLIPFSLIVWGQIYIASGLASILNATTPMFTVLVAHVLTTDEKATGGRIFGVVMGLAGVTLMIGPDVLQQFDEGVVGQIAVVGAAVSYALAGIYGRRFVRMGLSPMTTATGQLTAASILLLPVALLVLSALDIGNARSLDTQRRRGAGAALHSTRVHNLFSNSSDGRRDKFAFGHVPRARQRHPAWHVDPGRTIGQPPFRRYGLDRPWISGNRWPRSRPKPYVDPHSSLMPTRPASML